MRLTNPRYITCGTCRQRWNISRLQKIPPRGYECPHCMSKRKSGVINEQDVNKRKQALVLAHD